MSTPPPTKGRLSGIPTPGKTSGIPTPGTRLRSTSRVGQHPPQTQDDEFISRAFADAIKANDPAVHRPARSSDVSNASLSPSSLTYPSQSGRRSVTGRPSSVAASSSSAVSFVPSRTPTASSRTAPRPASRQSDVFARSSSRAGRAFEIGDSVRIESLGFEGTLRYLGEIDGKPGSWAGVELCGGFAGKGKNNGTVNGKQYFVCPPNCGVFVATTKLSAPTVGYGTISRPSSVASSRTGRVTPSQSLTGRMTPSTSTTIPTGRKTPSVSMANGRITPSMSNGRVTPSVSTGRRTPGIPSMSRARPTVSTAGTPVRNALLQSAITPGSRASKYVGMTAKQLDSRASGTVSPTRSFAYPSMLQDPTHVSSPTRSSSSPFTTPKAVPVGRLSNIGIGVPSTTPTKTRPSINTPRARLPSAIAMPPPASPSTESLSGRSVSFNDAQAKDEKDESFDLNNNAKVLHEKISELLSGRLPASGSRPDSSASVISSSAPELHNHVERLQSRLDSLEGENQRLRAAAEAASLEKASQAEKLLAEEKQSAAHIAELEGVVRTNERLLNERETTIEGLERDAQRTATDLDKVRSDAEARIRDVQSKLEDKEALVLSLKELLEAKEGLQSENDAVVRAKTAEIALLEARVQKAYAELEEERKELGSQVDELRKAGQETIALYEERLSAADSQRYELEDTIASLEEQLRAQARPLSPSTTQRQAASAAEIDNETLREQAQHLHKRIAILEDQLEDAHTTFDKEEAAVRERAKRYKENQDSMRREVSEGKEELARVLRAEESARQRVEEMEEALRENKLALENARAEIEGLRNEIADLEGINSVTASNSSEKVAEIAQRSAQERARLTEEIAQLRQQLAESLAQQRHASAVNGEEERDLRELHERLNALRSEKAALQDLCEQREAELAEEHRAVESLRILLEERTADVDGMRKKLNRDVPVNGVDGIKSSPSKYDLSAARDEITGLKHIVQELQKENSAAAQCNKVLESENKLLISETEQLREDLKALEENVEQSILREEQALAYESGGGVSPLASGDISVLQKKYEADLEQLRKKLMDAEMKSARTIHDLNKEIGELETLIESKIYREDELESELERLKEKLARSQRKSSKASTEAPLSSSSEERVHIVHSSTSVSSGSDEVVCEICERPGHDIFTCDLLKEEAAPLTMGPVSAVGVDEALFCEDCEGRGHTAANCPHSLDVF